MREPTRYGSIAFSAATAARQTAAGSIHRFGPFLGDGDDIGPADELDGRLTELIRSTDSFFFATVTPSGWPYIQHRGGPPGFVHVLDPSTLALADLPGNRQFVTVSNLDVDDRAALFFVDYTTRTRVKVFGRGRVVERTDDPDLVARVATADGVPLRGRCERALVVRVEAFDANCPGHIPVKYDAARTEQRIRLIRETFTGEIDTLRARNRELEAELARLRSGGPDPHRTGAAAPPITPDRR